MGGREEMLAAVEGQVGIPQQHRHPRPWNRKMWDGRDSFSKLRHAVTGPPRVDPALLLSVEAVARSQVACPGDRGLSMVSHFCVSGRLNPHKSLTCSVPHSHLCSGGD